jgi:outer membrane immunogenic protein
MNSLIKKTVTILAAFALAFSLLTTSQAVFAETGEQTTSLLEDFDSLSGNDVLLNRAQELAPDIRTQIVQNRVVERKKRFEFSPQFTSSFGGNSYVKTNMLGASAQYHLNYRFSIGARYDYAFNELTAEGENMVKNPQEIRDGNGVVVGYAPNIPALDYIKQSYFATANWYPIYGKFSMYDLGIVHFDIYALGGAGQVELESGPSDALTAGAGMAFWISQHLTSRFELRWMGYQASLISGAKEDVNLTLGTLSFGYLL